MQAPALSKDDDVIDTIADRIIAEHPPDDPFWDYFWSMRDTQETYAADA